MTILKLFNPVIISMRTVKASNNFLAVQGGYVRADGGRRRSVEDNSMETKFGAAGRLL
jgi:hypothetical protein